MTLWLTWARNALMAWLALTAFAAVATELVAAALGFDPRLGEPNLSWYGLPLYDPWDFLRWGFALAPSHPWITVLSVALTGVLALAAFGVLALAGWVAPLSLPALQLRPGFERWDNLRQHGLLAANRLALGAVRRHPLAPANCVSIERGNVLVVGDPNFTDDALLATIGSWGGAVVLVDARGISEKLARHNVIRFAPGRVDGVSYNPFFAIRGGSQAWDDARRLARAFLLSSDCAMVDAFAVLVLNQLLTAPIEERNFGALRRHLGEPHRVLAETCAIWNANQLRDQSPHCDIVRAVRVWRDNPNATLALIARIDAALELFSVGQYGQATASHQFRFADLVAADEPTTLVIATPPGEATRAAPLVSTMLAQLVTECALASDVDHLGQRKERDLLIVMEANACRALGVATADEATPLIAAHAADNGCYLAAQAFAIEQAPGVSYDAVVAIGPQTETTAARLSDLGGMQECWRRANTHHSGWRRALLPAWERVSRPIVAQGDLTNAQLKAATLFLKTLVPIRAMALTMKASGISYLGAADLAPVSHDWMAPPASHEAATNSEPPTQAPKPIGAQIRQALRRKPIPASKPANRKAT